MAWSPSRQKLFGNCLKAEMSEKEIDTLVCIER